MERDELTAWLRLTLTPGVGNSSARKLLGAFGLPQAVFESPTSALQQVVSRAQMLALRTPPHGLDALVERTWAWLQQDAAVSRAHQVVTLGDPTYPPALLNLDDPPLLLYLLGSGSLNPPDTQVRLAMVGSRNPTPQGASNARLFARAFAQAGVCVVSGLALGIDGAAHAGALDGARPGQCATVAVVGTGLDRVYPRAHHDLAHRIAGHGLLVSEYPLGTPPLTANFPRRNRLIAGLAQGTLVVEAALKSGSLITARLSSEQGKDVFAVPGSIHAAQSRGCHALIKQGAKLIECAQDVLEELAPPADGAASASDLLSDALNDSATASTLAHDGPLLQALGFDPVGLESLQARTGLDTASLQAQLMGLELDGQLARLPGGLFQRQTRPPSSV